MQNKRIHCRAIIGVAGLLLVDSALAFDMGNMMNPSKWMGGNNDRYDDDYYDGPGYGYPGGPPGYGYGGPPGYGYGGPPGYGYGGGPGYGYGGPPGYGYGGPAGYGGAPGYGYGGAPAYGATGSGANEQEIMRLQERLRQLEGGGPR